MPEGHKLQGPPQGRTRVTDQTVIPLNIQQEIIYFKYRLEINSLPHQSEVLNMNPYICVSA